MCKKVYIYRKDSRTAGRVLVWCGLVLSSTPPAHTGQYAAWTIYKGDDIDLLKVALRVLSAIWDDPRKCAAACKYTGSVRAFVRAMRQGAKNPRRNPFIF